MNKMRKILFLAMIAIFATGSLYAQKSVLKDAKRAIGNDLNEARTLIKQATTNPETATEPETWKVWGDIGNKAFDNERTLEMLGKQSNQQAMFEGLLESYRPYLVADSLGELPDEKGRVRNKYRKDIAGILKANHPFYINGGIFFNEKQDYKKAGDFFEIYWNIPSLPMYAGQKDAFLMDSTYQTIKYYAVISAILAKDHNKAIGMLKRISEEPFIENSTYKESDVYELISGEYLQIGDTTLYMKTLYEGAEKFPKSKFFIPNLVNAFIKDGDNAKAMEYLDKAISNDPSNACDLNTVKGALLADKGDYAAAESEYKKALAQDPQCARAMESMAVNYILQAQDLKEKTATLNDRKQQVENDKKTIELYQLALPHLEKYTQILKGNNAEKADIDAALMKLRNVYYNLSLMGVDKSAQLKEVEKELEL